MRQITGRLRKLPQWTWITVAFVLLEISAVVTWWKCTAVTIEFTDLLTVMLVIVTTVYVGLTYGLWREANQARIVEFHPILDLSFFKSVDPFDHYVPETRELTKEYLSQVSPEASLHDCDIALRYENLRIRNAGRGQIANLVLDLRISVPGLADKMVRCELKPYLDEKEELLLTLFPFRGLPSYKIEIIGVEYSDYFGSYNRYYGPSCKREVLPYEIPPETKKQIFYEDFYDVPFGKPPGWKIDDWRTKDRDRISELIWIDGNHMIFTGDEDAFGDRDNKKGVSHFDLRGRLKYGHSYEIQCRVRSDPGTKARVCLWCHDIHPEGGTSFKQRCTEQRTPRTDWEVIELVYTATQTNDIRIHLKYFPGPGTIHVDEVRVFEIQE